MKDLVSKIIGAGVQLSQDELHNIFNAGAYHGLWSQENYGEYDRNNTVYNFIETVLALSKSISMESAGLPCYGPNEWGTECGRCSKCTRFNSESKQP